MANGSQDPIDVAKKVREQMQSFPKQKSLEWRIDFLRWKLEKDKLGDCCKNILEGAEVALKVEEKFERMEAKVKTGEGDEELRLKVEHWRRKIEKYHFLMHLLSVSNDPDASKNVLGTISKLPYERLKKGRQF